MDPGGRLMQVPHYRALLIKEENINPIPVTHLQNQSKPCWQCGSGSKFVTLPTRIGLKLCIVNHTWIQFDHLSTKPNQNDGHYPPMHAWAGIKTGAFSQFSLVFTDLKCGNSVNSISISVGESVDPSQSFKAFRSLVIWLDGCWTVKRERCDQGVIFQSP